MVLWDTSSPSAGSAGFLNKVTIPGPSNPSVHLLAWCAVSSMNLDLVTELAAAPGGWQHHLPVEGFILPAFQVDFQGLLEFIFTRQTVKLRGCGNSLCWCFFKKKNVRHGVLTETRDYMLALVSQESAMSRDPGISYFIFTSDSWGTSAVNFTVDWSSEIQLQTQQLATVHCRWDWRRQEGEPTKGKSILDLIPWVG